MIYESLFEFDKSYRIRYPLLCGADEAGRGPLAGPVVCAAVILPPDAVIEDLNDSKKMSEKKRLKVFEAISGLAADTAVVMIDNEEIDRINILNASMKGMAAAVGMLKQPPDCALIDGNRVPAGLARAECVVKGDSLSASVAAASVLAKVTRDRYMLEMDLKYPHYGFARHKGYPTVYHYQMIEKYGICEIHRKSFLKGRFR